MPPESPNPPDNSTDVELWHRLGEIAFASGRPDIAGDCFRAAAAFTPLSTGLLLDKVHAAGIRFLNEGKFTDAERELRLAVRINPHIAAFHDHLGVALAAQKRFAEAAVCFRLSTRLDPTYFAGLKNLTKACLDLRRFAEAENAATAALRLASNDADLTLQLVIALGEQGKFVEAETMLSASTNPQLTHRLRYALGAIYGTAGKYLEAERCFREVLRSEPNSAQAYSNLAAALGKSNRWSEAAEAGRKAVELDPKNATAWSNLGNALRDLGRLDEAETAIREAWKIDPSLGDSLGNLGLVYAMRGRYREAIAHYDQALRLRPHSAEIHFNHAVANLSLGNFAEGWVEYEWRRQMEQQKNERNFFPTKIWDGKSPLVGKTIVVHTEQGAGDSIQFVRLIEDLTRLGARTHLVAPTELIPLLKSCPGVGSIGDLNETPAHDLHCSLMSLPGKLRVGTELPLPGRTPYLSGDQDLVDQWRLRLSGISGLKVGIAWQGNPKHLGDRWRSVPLTHFQPLAEVPGTSLISLQKGPGSEQIAHSPFPIIDLGGELSDFADTAALILNLDLVIAVDTAVVHLAGALNKAVWILLPLNADWRWLTDREDSPWYPSARLFRQAKFGDWPPVFARAAMELRNRTCWSHIP